jgi:hypothetical protein
MDLGTSPQPGDAGFPSSAQPCLPCRNRSNSTHQSPPPSGEASREGRQGSALLCCQIEFIINSNLSLIFKKLSLPPSEATASPLLPPTHTKYVFPNSIRCPWIRETEKGNSRAKYVFPNSIPFFGCCCEKTPIQFFTDGLEKKRERKETGLVYSSIFSNYTES